jgi:hypothetical protein
MIGSFLVWVKAKKTIHRLMFEQVTTWEGVRKVLLL